MSELLKKLRYRPGMRVYVSDAPVGYETALAGLPKGIERARALRGQFDLVHAFFTRKGELARSVPRLRDALKPDGILWLSYPKGDALSTDLKRDVVRETVATMGLETVAQVSIDEVWSALRCKAS